MNMIFKKPFLREKITQIFYFISPSLLSLPPATQADTGYELIFFFFFFFFLVTHSRTCTFKLVIKVTFSLSLLKGTVAEILDVL